MANDIKQIRAFFSTLEKPVSLKEMQEFWGSLTDEEKNYYKEAELV